MNPTLARYQYDAAWKRGDRVQVLFAADKGLDWIDGTVERVERDGRVIVRRDDGGYIPSAHPASIRRIVTEA